MRRFRLTFSKGEPVRYISHLDLMRTWERILRRARLKVAHSQGFNPRPKLVFAAPLSVGITSDAEIVDVDLEEDLPPDELAERLRAALAPGIELRSVVDTPLEAASVMGSVLWGEYALTLATAADVDACIRQFLASETVPYERKRKGGSKQADMRPAVLDLWVETDPRPGPLPQGEGTARIGMRLRLDTEGLAVRPDEVVAALDANWQVRRVHRTALQLKDAPGTLTLPSPAAAGEGGGRHAA